MRSMSSVRLAVLAIYGICAASTSRAASGIGPDAASCITQKMRQADSRLELPISLRNPQIYLGDLAAAITKLTGVEVATGQRDGSSDVKVCIYCTKIPLGDLLNDLWSLLSYRGSQWTLDRTGTAGSFHYVLRQPVSANRARQQIRAWLVGRFGRIFQELVDACDGDEDVRRHALEDAYGTPIREFAGTPMEVLWGQLRIVRDVLPRDRIAEFARGTAATTVIEAQVNSLSDGSRAFLDRERELLVRNMNPPGDLPPQESISVRLQRSGSFPLVTVGYYSMRTAPYYLGGGELGPSLAAHIRALWTLDGDTLDGAMENLAIRTAQVPQGALASLEGAGRNGWTRFEAVMFELAAGTNTSLLARLPDDEPQWLFQSPGGSTLQEFWKQMEGQPVIHKWRNGVHLVSPCDWPLQDEPVPLAYVRSLQKSADARRFLGFNQLTETAATLTQDQITRLKVEFPVMDAVARARPLFALMWRRPELLRKALGPDGAPLDAEIEAALRQLPESPLDGYLDQKVAAYLTLQDTLESAGDSPSRKIMFTVLNRDRKPLISMAGVDNQRAAGLTGAGKR